MDYPHKDRRFKWDVVDYGKTPPKVTPRFVDRDYYEWTAPDNSLFRAPDPAILDRRRWNLEGFEPEEIEEEIRKRGKTQPILPGKP